MMAAHRARKLSLLLFTALLVSCALNPLAGDTEDAETFYLDAAGGFAIEYPAHWQRLPQTSPSTVRWMAQGEGGQEPEILAAVTSLEPTEAVGGYERMLADFTAAHPGFVLGARDEVEIGTIPALQITGHMTGRTLLAFFVTTYQRAFLLEFSARADRFDRHRPLFREIADSLEVLQ